MNTKETHEWDKLSLEERKSIAIEAYPASPDMAENLAHFHALEIDQITFSNLESVMEKRLLKKIKEQIKEIDEGFAEEGL